MHQFLGWWHIATIAIFFLEIQDGVQAAMMILDSAVSYECHWQWFGR